MDKSGLWLRDLAVSGPEFTALCLYRSLADSLKRLAIFVVEIADNILYGFLPSWATYAGGVLIVVAFGLLAHDTLAGGHK